MGESESASHAGRVATEHMLQHFGVKGMRWGVRRSNPSGGSGKAEKPKSLDAKKATAARDKAKKHGLDSLTNDELKTLVNRMQLEQNYKNLKVKNLSGGKAFARKTAKEAADRTTKELIGKGITVGVAALSAALAAKKLKNVVD